MREYMQEAERQGESSSSSATITTLNLHSPEELNPKELNKR